MGFAIAAEAARRGAEVTLIAGPTTIEPPPVREVVRVRSAAEMHARRDARAPSAMHVVVMAAAVADYTPARRAEQKVAKGDGRADAGAEEDADILGDLGQRRAGVRASGPLLVGFAAETENVVARATAKRERSTPT